MNFNVKALAVTVLSVLIMGAMPLTSFAAPEAAPKEDAEQRPVSAAEAVALLTEAAGKGQASAMLSLGSLYENGIGVARNYTTAFEWYKKAAEAKQAEGFYNLGVCYEIGLGVTANPVEAMNNFKLAAEMDLPQAYYKLSSIYLAGELVAKDVNEALKQLNEAAEAGHSLAANELGVIYLNGMLEQKPDGKKALAMFTMSAELGNPEAMKNIAVMYKDGLSRDKEPANALKWYIIAQNFGYKAADINQIIDALKNSLKEKEMKKAEEDATKWTDEVRAELAEKAAKN